jgi:cell wall-associated NlpC family hydrolase
VSAVRCSVAVAPLRVEPDESAEQVTQALRGEPLFVEDRHGGWARVRTAYDYPGWVRADQIEIGVGALPADETGTPIEVARSYLGAPYLWGGLTEQGIDCSGLVHMAYRRLGRLIPRDAAQQEREGRAVEAAELRPGDLISYGDSADHIAFWLGKGRILHSAGRDGGLGVVEEREPDDLRNRRHRLIRL